MNIRNDTIRARLNAAPTGPWCVVRGASLEDGPYCFVGFGTEESWHRVGDTTDDNLPPEVAEFIAHAPTDLAALLDENKALLDENERLRAALDDVAEKVREAAEQWLYNGDRDCPLPGYNEVQDLADTIERFPLVVPVSAGEEAQP
jgi:hypothetical protein